MVELVLGQSKLPADHDRAATGQISAKKMGRNASLRLVSAGLQAGCGRVAGG